MIGAQASNDQLEKILSYIDIGKAGGRQGAHRRRAQHPRGRAGRRLLRAADRAGGPQPMRVFQEEIFGPVVSSRSSRTTRRRSRSPTTRSTASAPASGRATARGPIRFGRGIQAGRVWTNCYHAYPAHAAFGGYKQSGIGRENHKMMLDHYQQTKNLLVSYSPKALGFF
jgi:aldehyde dehydrogenase